MGDATERLPAEADVVVIGSGAFGSCTAYHLAVAGAGRVMLLDRGELGSGSSPRAAGLFKMVQADELLTRLSHRSAAIVRGFEATTGIPLPVTRSGSLLAARTSAHADLIRAELAQSRVWGVEAEEIDAATARRAVPWLDPGAFQVAVHVHGDMFIEEPPDLLQAVQRAARDKGVATLANTTATALRVTDGRVVGVATDRGEITCPVVVDAAGAWAKSVVASTGGRVMAATIRHQLAISEPTSGVDAGHPIVRIIDASAYVRPHKGGFLFGGFEPDPTPLEPPVADPAWSIATMPLDARVPIQMGRRIAAQIPALANPTVLETRGGLFTMTPDARFLAGPSPDVAGLWLNTGCNGSGYSFAPAIGEALAAWITTGSPTVDMSPLSPERFRDHDYSDRRLIELGVFQYENYYSPPDVAARLGGAALTRS
ncbi:MAG: FAD-binding oxidoreductase [Thermomicrobiales bacterium]|nr:FAD-binding oxidoreductase [Thermomicrobiales bacterium]